MSKKIIIVGILLIILLSDGLIISKSLNKDKGNKIHLTEKYYGKTGFIEVDENKINESETFLLFTYNNYCNLRIPCDEIFETFTKGENISILSITFEDFKKTKYYEEVKFAPSVMIINKGKIIAYLDANSDADMEKYQDVSEFAKWLDKYIYFEK